MTCLNGCCGWDWEVDTDVGHSKRYERSRYLLDRHGRIELSLRKVATSTPKTSKKSTLGSQSKIR